MKSSHCQMTVTSVVNQAGGTLRSISSGQADIELGDEATENIVVAGIEKAGYKITNRITV